MSVMCRWLFAAIVVASAFPTASQATVYTLTDLGDFGGTSARALGINDVGDVVGWAETPDHRQEPFLYRNGVLTKIGEGAPSTSTADGGNAVNNQGDVVGRAGAAGHFVYSGDSLQYLASTPTVSELTDINDLGQAVGRTSKNAFIWTAAKGFTQLPALFEAFGINNSGTVAGRLFNNSAGLVYSTGVVQDLGNLHSIRNDFGRATDLNDNGQIVGYSSAGAVNGEPLVHAFLYDSTHLELGMQDLGSLFPNNSSYANAVNASGVVVGRSNAGYYPAPGPQYGSLLPTHAFVYHNGVMTDLNYQVVNVSGWQMLDATDINASGQIVGYATHNGYNRAVLLTPFVPEPSSLLLAVGGLAVLLGARRRFGTTKSRGTKPIL